MDLEEIFTFIFFNSLPGQYPAACCEVFVSWMGIPRGLLRRNSLTEPAKFHRIPEERKDFYGEGIQLKQSPENDRGDHSA